MTPEQMEQAYRKWWADSYNISPNKQAVVTAVAWGQHLQELLSPTLKIAKPPQS